MTRVALLVLTSIAATARAELKWEQTLIESHPPFGARQAVAHFKYQNIGKTPFHINSVHPSCGCTAAELVKNTVSPAESGDITVTFTIGDRTGTQVRDVTVKSSDPDHGSAITKLLLKAVIAAPIEIQPALVYWNTGEEPKPKTIMVKATAGSVRSISLTVSDPDFRARFDRVGDSQFKITVQPVETTKAARATIKVQPEGSPKIFSATAVVTGKPATTAMQ
jgi:hypothetical protein